LITVLQKVLEARGWSVADLCRASNTYHTEVYRLQNGSGKAGRRLQQRLATALGVVPGDLFDEQGWPLPAQTLRES